MCFGRLGLSYACCLFKCKCARALCIPHVVHMFMKIVVHQGLSSAACTSIFLKQRYTSGLPHTCASRLKNLGPAAVEDLSAEEQIFGAFGPYYDTDVVQEFIADVHVLSESETAVAGGDRHLQQCYGTPTTAPLLQQFGDDWTESKDDDISYAVNRLVRRIPKPVAVNNISASWPSLSLVQDSKHDPAQIPAPRQQLPLFEQQQGEEQDVIHKGLSPKPANTAAAAAAEEEESLPPGSFFPSRANMLAELQQQQRQLQRQMLLQKQRKHLYTYTLSDSGEIVKMRRPGLQSPVQQTEFKLAKVRPAVHADPRDSGSSGGSAIDMADAASGGHAKPSMAYDNGSGTGTAADTQVLLQHQQQRQQQRLQQQWSALHDVEAWQQWGTPGQGLSSNSNSGTGDSVLYSGSNSSSSTGSTRDDDPSRGVCLSAFLYCCSRNKLLSLTWQLGLPPGALKFVSNVSDADMVLHVKQGKGERHYQYDDYRQQAAAKGIPFVDLKNLSLQELQQYLLPVYGLYAGELSPRDVLKRPKRRGWNRRYTSIKLPPA